MRSPARRSPARVWTTLAVAYAAFFAWYTPFGGPLAPEEIERYVAVLEAGGADAERIERFRRFMETDTGDDFAMQNAIALREAPLEVDGAVPGETSPEVMARYARPFLAEAFRSAGHPVFLGRAAAGALDLWGVEGASTWTSGALVRYRSRRDLMEQIALLSERGDDIHRFKVAAIAKTIAFPVDPWFHLGDPRLLLGLIAVAAGLAWHLRHALRAAHDRPQRA